VIVSDSFLAEKGMFFNVACFFMGSHSSARTFLENRGTVSCKVEASC